MSERSSMPDMSRLSRFARTSVRAAIILVIVLGLAAVALGRTAPTGSSGGAGDPRPRATAGPGTPAATMTARSPTPAGSTPTCTPSRPEPVFVPTGSAPAVPPAYYQSSWFGSARLWTMLNVGGEIWRGLPQSASGLTQKTFWWSQDWHPRDEPQPAIMVTGRQLDGTGSFIVGPGTNATADFGTAMLVGIEVPTTGCWEITAHYRSASLSFTVLVESPQAS